MNNYEQPTLALVIPTINRADLLDEALRLYAHTWRGRHQFILDNGNQDIQTYSSWQTIIKSPKNLGVPKSWNVLMRACKTKGYTHVAILNDDIVWKRNADEIEDYIKLNPYDFYQGLGTWCCFVLPMATYQEVGEFDEGYARSYFEDNDMNIRMLRANKKIKADIFFNPEVYRNSQTIAKDPSLNSYFGANQQRYIDKWGGMPNNETYQLPWNGGEGYDIPW
jgi:GT2 family glycosyltransferase